MRIKIFSIVLLIFVFFAAFAASLFAVHVVPESQIKIIQTVDFSFTEGVITCDSGIVSGIESAPIRPRFNFFDSKPYDPGFDIYCFNKPKIPAIEGLKNLTAKMTVKKAGTAKLKYNVIIGSVLNLNTISQNSETVKGSGGWAFSSFSKPIPL